MNEWLPQVSADDYVPCPDIGDPHGFAAVVVGDSMKPEYHDGNIVVFSPSRTVRNGSDCFVRLTGERTTFKQVFFEGGETLDEAERLRLQPLNRRFKSLVIDRSEALGVYVAVWKLVKLRPQEDR